MQGVENERLILLKTHGANSEQSVGEYRKLRSDLQALLQQMKNVQPLFLSFEKNYDNIRNWLSNQVGIFFFSDSLYFFYTFYISSIRFLNEILIFFQILTTNGL